MRVVRCSVASELCFWFQLYLITNQVFLWFRYHVQGVGVISL